MNIFCISVVKNEEDIIEYNLQKASEWAEKIFVMDNGSEDRTWDIVRELGNRNPKIVPWKTTEENFYDGLRGELFNQFRHYAAENDWWCFRLDADEFYYSDPRDFLKTIPSSYHFVCSDAVEYQLTFEDLEEYNFEGNFPADVDKINYVLPRKWAEMRFFRHRKRLKWREKDSYPKHIGIVYPIKIPRKHYQFRSPAQIIKRIETRNKAVAGGLVDWKHHRDVDWKGVLMHRRDLIKASQDEVPQNLTEANNHLHKPLILFAKRILHGTGILP